MDHLLKAEVLRRARTVRSIRATAIGLTILMCVVSGHLWNSEKVHAPMVYAYDFMILMMTVFIIAVMMDDASELRKNITAVVSVILAGLLTAFVLI